MTSDGPVRAVTFVANRAHLRYAGRLDEASVAARLATATGSPGQLPAYLSETLERCGRSDCATAPWSGCSVWRAKTRLTPAPTGSRRVRQIICRDQFSNSAYEALCSCQLQPRPVARDFRVGANFIICNCLQIVCLRQTDPKPGLNSDIVFGQPKKLGMHTAMRFQWFSGSLEDQALRCMELGEIGGSSGRVVEPDPQHGFRLRNQVPCLVQITRRLRCHRSIPSCLISCMSAVCSR